MASEKGLVPTDGDRNRRVYICPHCDRPTYFSYSAQTPGVKFGNHVDKVPSDVDGLYNEARVCYQASAYTASVMASRKLLMNIAVNKGAPVGRRFVEYVDFLATNGWVPPDGKPWVEHIKNKGNEANHEIALMTSDDAEELVVFAEMLLKFIYEFTSRVPPPSKS